MFWFKTGEWVAVSMFDLFLAPDGISSILPPSSPYNALPDMLWGSWVWIVRPTDWYGLHKIASGLLRFIPLSLASLVVGYLPMILASAVEKSFAHTSRNAR